uniref:Anaphylatoxin-like domain-containing protein n=1 Tax=Pelusios castaneus TaxID=367368 RepID=A0A8C8SJ48_9SAUR
MAGSVLCLASLVVFCFPAVSHSQLYTLISPNVLRVENEEKIVVEAHGLTTSTQVTIAILDFPLRRQNLSQAIASLTPENGMMGTAVVKVPANTMMVDSKQNQYVIVQARFPQQTLEQVVLVHFHSGYLFIQTDKMIYRPLSTGTVFLCFLMEVSVHTSGTWKIMAWYEDSPQLNFSAQFDVKEYVLPSFEVTLEPSDKFVYIDENKDLKVSIDARWPYGVFVEWIKAPQLCNGSIIDGAGEAVLTRAMLKARFQNLNELLGHSIYVTVTVLTDSGTKVEEVENIKIVTSPPYQIHFTNTPKYFKPGTPFELMVRTLLAGTRTSLSDHLQDSTLIQTLEDGMAKLNVKTAVDREQLHIYVRTAFKNQPENRQVFKSMVAEAYQTQEGSKNYLHLLVSATEVQSRDNLLVSFNVKTNRPADLNQIPYITYLILNKGMIIRAGRQAKGVGQTLVTLSLPITPDLMPSFRIVGYYHMRQREIVADSVWIDVKGSCMGRLVIRDATEVDNRIHRPGSPMRIKIEGDRRASIALVAMDKGVNFLTKKHTITQTQIWEAVENNDLGCTPGGGKDNLGVFADAGLALVTNVKISTPTRTDPKCPKPAVFRRRSTQLSKANKVAWHQDENLRRCCEDGMYENPMGHSCEKRAQYIQKGEECKRRFLSCCNYIKMVREKQQGLPLETSSKYWDIISRSLFPETWLWQIELPYSVVRNESVEIQAILHNYQNQDIKVQFVLMHNTAFCSPSSSKANYQQIISMKARSSKAIPLVIVPLELGFHNIEIKASQLHSFVGDVVKKKLNVVVELRLSHCASPTPFSDGVQEVKVKAADLDDMVPNTESLTGILFQGRPVVRLTEEPIKGANLNHLIMKPFGNGEFNIMKMSTAVVITHYLDVTEQWEGIGVDGWVDALSTIMQGYTQQLAFKKPDHSYAATINRPSSTWLTAFIAKVFAMATTQVHLEHRELCGAVRWLVLEKQRSDGAFKEDTPVIHSEMVGGYQGAEPDVSLTAFVLIAILESKVICEDHPRSFEGHIRKAGEYLTRRYSSLARPYAVAITTYALALLETHMLFLFRCLDGNRWEEQGPSTFSIEGTSYALLALLRLKRFDLAGPVVRWLTQQTYSAGDSIATTMMFQALAQYHRDALIHEDVTLEVSFLLPRHSKMRKHRFHHRDMHLTRITESKFNENFTIRAEGNGQVTLTVVTVYNARLEEDKAQCKSFELRVSVQEAPGGKSPFCHFCFEWYLHVTDSNMAVLNVSMPTGFLPDTEDLTRLSQGADRYISRYEMNKALLDEGYLIIYLDKVSHGEADCLRFKAHQFFEVGLIKPLKVTVYEYQTLGNRSIGILPCCLQRDLTLSSFPTENCFKQSQMNGSVTPQTRLEEACRPEVNFGTDENPEGKTRVFISLSKCREILKLELNSYYLIWGLSSDLSVVRANISYVISKDTWIEKWPSENKCQEVAFKNLCIEYEEFSQAMMLFGCPQST